MDRPLVEPRAPEEERAPVVTRTPREWIRENLFNSVPNGIMTVVFGALLGFAVFKALRFVFVSAEWDIVRRNLTTFMVGLFPRDELWRPWLAAALLAAAIGVRIGAAARARRQAAIESGLPPPPGMDAVGAVRRSWPLLLLAVVLLSFARTVQPALLLLAVVGVGLAARLLGDRLPAAAARWTWLSLVAGVVLAVGAVIWFDGVGWDRWGGLMLTLFLAATGIVLSFPIGVLLALGRRSTLPAVRAVSVAYIELIRGVPLITLLFMGAFALGFFLPRGFSTPSVVVRAIVALVAFTAAYIAEIVRGGLQSVPKGQVEAAMALGLPPQKVLRLIVLPQALRAVIPAIVGQFISLFKDTSLVAIIGLTELLRIAQTVTAQPEFVGRGLHAETLFFAALIYWVGAYWMSRRARRLEQRLGVGER